MSFPTQLEVLSDNIKNCKRCPLSRLLPGGSTPIPYDGPENANIIMVGESPGSEEAEQNKPFVGRSGKLLNSILKNAGVNREDVGILNVAKCWTWEYGNKDKHSSKTYKKNRTVTELEINSCKDWLKQEIDLIQPLLVFSLGKIALRAILEIGSENTLKFNSSFQLKNYLYKRMGSIKLWPKITLIPLYHPSFLLQYGSKKDLHDTEQVIELAVSLMRNKLEKENNVDI